MIIFNFKETTAIMAASRAMSAVYYGTRLVWQAVRSCFGSGVWVSHKPWLGQEKWKKEK